MTAYSGLRLANDRQGGGRRVKGEGKWAATRKAPIPASRPLSGILRSREAEEAIAEHESAQKAFHENRERLREERLRREEAAGPMLYPAPELPDHTPSRASDLLPGSGMHSMLRE